MPAPPRPKQARARECRPASHWVLAGGPVSCCWPGRPWRCSRRPARRLLHGGAEWHAPWRQVCSLLRRRASLELLLPLAHAFRVSLDLTRRRAGGGRPTDSGQARAHSTALAASLTWRYSTSHLSMSASASSASSTSGRSRVTGTAATNVRTECSTMRPGPASAGPCLLPWCVRRRRNGHDEARRRDARSARGAHGATVDASVNPWNEARGALLGRLFCDELAFFE